MSSRRTGYSRAPASGEHHAILHRTIFVTYPVNYQRYDMRNFRNDARSADAERGDGRTRHDDGAWPIGSGQGCSGFGSEDWSVVAFGRNIGDEDWLQAVIPAPEFGGSFTHPGTQSRYGMEATWRF